MSARNEKVAEDEVERETETINHVHSSAVKLEDILHQLRAVTLRLILGSHLVFSGCLERKFPESRGLSARE